jgi:hypothetical protein
VALRWPGGESGPQPGIEGRHPVFDVTEVVVEETVVEDTVVEGTIDDQ